MERIRQKNLEDNQRFLEKLLMTNVRDLLVIKSGLPSFFFKIRNDFVNSARSILRQDGNDQIRKHFPRQYEKYIFPGENPTVELFLESNMQLDTTKK